jgi:hypothetical protein
MPLVANLSRPFPWLLLLLSCLVPFTIYWLENVSVLRSSSRSTGSALDQALLAEQQPRVVWEPVDQKKPPPAAPVAVVNVTASPAVATAAPTPLPVSTKSPTFMKCGESPERPAWACPSGALAYEFVDAPLALSIPNCTTESWCSKLYQSQIMDRAKALLYGNQFPSNCSSARYLIATTDWRSGLGSFIHMRAMMLVAALNERRVLIMDPAIRSPWTHAQDAHAPCRARDGVLCYWQPITNCTLPPDWRKHNLTQPFELGSPHRFVSSPTNSNNFPFREGGRSTPTTGIADLDAMPHLWWKSLLAHFLTRPNAHMMSEVIAPTVNATFGGTGAMPSKFLSVFMRQGDKGREAALHGAEEYFLWMSMLGAKHNISAFYIATDSSQALHDLLSLVASKTRWQVYYIKYPRSKHGLEGVHLKNVYSHTPKIREIVNAALTDLYISAHAWIWLGTLSSNWCRLQDEWRRATGRHGAPYFSLDRLKF